MNRWYSIEVWIWIIMMILQSAYFHKPSALSTGYSLKKKERKTHNTYVTLFTSYNMPFTPHYYWCCRINVNCECCLQSCKSPESPLPYKPPLLLQRNSHRHSPQIWIWSALLVRSFQYHIKLHRLYSKYILNYLVASSLAARYSHHRPRDVW